MTTRQIRRVALVGALALPLSAALMWTSISPVSATSVGTTTLVLRVSQNSQTTTVSVGQIRAARDGRAAEARRPRERAAVREDHATSSPSSSTSRAKPTSQVVIKNTTVTKTAKPTVTRTSDPTATGTATSSSNATSATTAASPAPTIANPSSDIAPSPDFLQSGTCTQSGSGWSCANPCVSSSMSWPTLDNNVSCTNYLLEAINNARSIEGIGPMVLPGNWYSLSTTEQLFVVANLERTARGLPAYLGINATLSAEAQRAAASDADPVAAPGFAVGTDAQGDVAMGGAWSGGFAVLAADYMWMYDDGWGGSAASTSNVDCTGPSAAGCWSHRDELLGDDPGYNPGVGLTCADCEMGVGYAVVNGTSSFVDLIEKPAATPPAMIFTWADESA